jgi:hypothetical protein
MLVLRQTLWQIFLLQIHVVKTQKIDEDFGKRNKQIELRDGHFINYKNYKRFENSFEALLLRP